MFAWSKQSIQVENLDKKGMGGMSLRLNPFKALGIPNYIGGGFK